MATVEAVHGEVMIEVFALVACAHSARGQPPRIFALVRFNW